MKPGRGLAALALCIAATLAGCATRPPAVEGLPWTSGRLSVRTEAADDRPASGVSADFDLRGNGREGELRLSSPLGMQLAHARWSASGAVLSTGSSETRFADLEELSRETLGEVLPLRALPDWLAGRPWAGAPSEPEGQGFAQLGWRVSLDGYSEGRIDAVRLAPPVVTVRVRLERPT